MSWRSFFLGMGSVLDIFGVGFGDEDSIQRSRPELPKTDEEAFQRDADALRGDWERAMGKWKDENVS